MITNLKNFVILNEASNGKVRLQGTIIVDGFVSENSDDNPSSDMSAITVPAGEYEFITRSDNNIVLRNDTGFYFITAECWNDHNVQDLVTDDVSESAEEPTNTLDDLYGGLLSKLVDKLSLDGMSDQANEYFDDNDNRQQALQWLDENMEDEMVDTLESKIEAENVNSDNYANILDGMAADAVYESFKSYFTQSYQSSIALNSNEGIIDFLKSKAAKISDAIKRASGKHEIVIDGQKHNFVIPGDAKPILSGNHDNTLRLHLSDGAMLLMRNNGFWRMSIDGALAGSMPNQDVKVDKGFKQMLEEVGKLLGGIPGPWKP